LSIITKEEWTEWKQNNVTRAFFEAARQRVEDCKEILVQSAGLEPGQDRFYVGFAAAYNEMPSFHIEDLDEEDNED
jgi:glucose-6-phosphate dehydrogenase assembly protein OpcA